MAGIPELQDPSRSASGDEPLYEIVNGHWREHKPMGVFEAVLASVLSRYMGNFAEQNRLGIVATEALFRLREEPLLHRRPDLAFVSYSRWPDQAVPRSEAWNAVPDLVVEFISPTNSAEQIDEKIVEYFEAGVRMAWVLYPDTGRVYIYRSANNIEVRERTDQLDGGDVLPNFQLPIETLFDAVRKPS